MNNYRKILRNRKARIARRLDPKRRWSDQPGPMLSASNIHYEMSEKTEAIGCGGIGAIHQMLGKLGLADEIDNRLHLLKVHLPYHESDHVLSLCYNTITGGRVLEDLELLRQDATFLKALNAQRIPDPTTAGDFTRRFKRPEQIQTLIDCINVVRQRAWELSGQAPFELALIDLDGTVAPTLGACKQGMEYSPHKRMWGYHPLIVSLANTGEVLSLVNRPGNAVSHEGAAAKIDEALDLVAPHAERICLRGDTDFYLTKHLDLWAKRADFVFGVDALPNLVVLAETLPEQEWEPLNRRPRYEVKTRKRDGSPRENVKERIVHDREFRNIRLVSEHIAETTYQPGNCNRLYRLVMLRKNLSVEEGDNTLFPEVRYFFYITTLEDRSAAKIVELANGRCDQENVIEQLKNGVNAMRMPVDNLLSNWAYMVMAALAWNVKAWFAMLVPDPRRRDELLKKDFRYFLNKIVRLPCQIIRQSRRITYRILTYNDWLPDFFATWERIRRLKLT